MKASRLVAIGALALVCPAGCASKNKGAAPATAYETLFKPQVSDVSAKRAGGLAKDGPDLEDLPEMTGEERERLGDSYFSKGGLHMAFVHYDKALRLSPDNPRLHYKKGLLFVAGGMNEDAIAEFQKVLEKEPNNALAYQGLGEAFFQSKRYDEAERHFKRALEIDPSLWKSHNFLGAVYDYAGRHDMASSEYHAAIALRPGSGLLYNNLGISHLLAGENEKAVWALERALELKAAGPRVYNNLGLALSRLGRMEEALEAFKKGGDEAQAYNNLGCAYMQRGEYATARRCFEKALALKPTFYHTADENLKRCLAADPLAGGRGGSVPMPEEKTWFEIPREEKPPPAAAWPGGHERGLVAYTVKKGDTAYSIAQRHGMPFLEFLKLNDLTDKSIIRPGQTLKVRGQ